MDEESKPEVKGRVHPTRNDTSSKLYKVVPLPGRGLGLVDMDEESKPEVKGRVHPERNDTSSKLYKVVPLPGRGLGLVATQDIVRGTRIISKKPLFTMPINFRTLRHKSVPLDPGFDPVASLIASKFNHLSEDDVRAFMSLQNNYAGDSHPLTGIVETNAIPLGQSGECGLFLEVSRINHSCRPNCFHTWNRSIWRQTVHAVRPISKGEELTINYIGLAPYEIRHGHLRDALGFECTCELCSLPPVERAISDTRLSEAMRLLDLFEDTSRFASSPDKCLEDAYTMLTLIIAEDTTGALFAKLYYIAFQIAISCGDQARAKIFAGRAYEGRLACYGDDSPSTAEVRPFVEHPAKHRLFGSSTRWAQPMSAIPTTLLGEDFEAWLWRRDK